MGFLSFDFLTRGDVSTWFFALAVAFAIVFVIISEYMSRRD